MVTEVRRNADNIKKNVPETFIPSVCDKLLEPIDIFIPDETQGTTYTVISSVDIKGDLKQIDSAAVLGFNGTFYMGVSPGSSLIVPESVLRKFEGLIM